VNSNSACVRWTRLIFSATWRGSQEGWRRRSFLADGLSASLSSSCRPVTPAIAAVVAGVVAIVVIAVLTALHYIPRCRHRDYHCTRNIPSPISPALKQRKGRERREKGDNGDNEVSNYCHPNNRRSQANSIRGKRKRDSVSRFIYGFDERRGLTSRSTAKESLIAVSSRAGKRIARANRSR